VDILKGYLGVYNMILIKKAHLLKNGNDRQRYNLNGSRFFGEGKPEVCWGCFEGIIVKDACLNYRKNTSLTFQIKKPFGNGSKYF
jgi:hypothetical protein